MKIKASSLSALAAQYGIDVRTFKNWLKPHPSLQPSQGQRLLTPKQVKEIYRQFGEPE